jgi:gamma-glutamyltranspeptidase
MSILLASQKKNAGYGYNETFTNRNYHYLAETYKSVFGQQSFVCDPTTETARSQIGFILTDFSTQSLAAKISANSTVKDSGYYGTIPDVAPTTAQSHISVIDKNGMTVSLSTSMGSSFGSGVMLPESGIILNNHIRDFNLEMDHPNVIDMAKRPASHMSPLIIVKNNESVKSMGAGGGAGIITSQIQLLSLLVDARDRLSAALNSPRIHHQLNPPRVFLENLVPVDAQVSLIRMGHELSTMWSEFLPTHPSVGYVQLVEAGSDGAAAFSDIRVSNPDY